MQMVLKADQLAGNSLLSAGQDGTVGSRVRTSQYCDEFFRQFYLIFPLLGLGPYFPWTCSVNKIFLNNFGYYVSHMFFRGSYDVNIKKTI